jgi:hypothetical protein
MACVWIGISSLPVYAARHSVLVTLPAGWLYASDSCLKSACLRRVCGAGPLWRGDSDACSSWGLPTPTSARTLAGGLSRFNSLGLTHPALQQAGAMGQLEAVQVGGTGGRLMMRHIMTHGVALLSRSSCFAWGPCTWGGMERVPRGAAECRLE